MCDCGLIESDAAACIHYIKSQEWKLCARVTTTDIMWMCLLEREFEVHFPKKTTNKNNNVQRLKRAQIIFYANESNLQISTKII